MRGRKPKPPALKIIEGNRGKRAIPEAVQPTLQPKPPRCPPWLESEAKKEWRRVVPELFRLGLFTELDVVPLSMYCQAYARYLESERQLSENGAVILYTNKHGATNETLSPHVYMSRIQFQVIRQFCAEFGLTPSSRGRIILPEGKEEDSFDAFVEEGRRGIGA